MEKKTHAAFGIATAIVILSPTTLKYKTLDIVASAIGSLIPDIDVTTSDTHKDITTISIVSLMLIVSILIFDYFFQFGIIKLISKNFNVAKFLVGASLFFLICAHGLHTPHRSFMHSIFAAILLSGTLYLIFKPAMIPFLIGMISHDILDLFNKTKVQLFYPFNYRFCFNLFLSNSIFSKIICFLSLFVAFISI